MRCRISEVFVHRDLGVGICLKQIELTTIGQAVVEAGISAEAEMAIDALGEKLEFAL